MNLERYLSEEKTISVILVDSTSIVAEMKKVQKTSAAATAALGRFLTASALMSADLKNDGDSLTLRIKGDGPVGVMIASADAKGNVKGYVENPAAEGTGVSAVVGKNGTLSVIRDLGLKEPVTAQIELVSGEIAEDITAYFALSAQIPAVCALGVVDGIAGGFLIKLLPGADEDVIEKIESDLKNVRAVTEYLSAKMSLEEIAKTVLKSFKLTKIGGSDSEYKCDCSLARVKKALIGLGRKELDEMIREDKKIEVCCNFCNNKYIFSEGEI